MTLAEFDGIHHLLLPDTEVIVKVTNPAIKQDEIMLWAVEMVDYGNCDGSINVFCRSCRSCRSCGWSNRFSRGTDLTWLW